MLIYISLVKQYDFFQVLVEAEKFAKSAMEEDSDSEDEDMS